MLLIFLAHFQPSLSSPTSARSAPYETRTLTAASGSWMTYLAAPSAAAAVARRTRCRPSSRGSELLPGSSQLTYLEGRSVSDPTLKDYCKKMRAFLEWAVQSGLDWTTTAGLDHALVLYMDKLFFLGMAGDVASKTLAAVKFYYPEVGRYGDLSLPRTSRALAGWGKVVPRKTRLPVPWVLVTAIVGHLLSRGLVEHAVAVLLSFHAYLRPGECDSLTPMQLVAPVAAAGSSAAHWALLLGPAELEKPTKVGAWDESVVLDQFGFLNDCLLKLKARSQKPDQRIWSFPPGDLAVQLQAAAESLGLAGMGITAYGLRHGGASHDLLERTRSHLEVKARGRWRSDSMLRRYGKEARALAELHKAPKSTVEYGRLVSEQLAAIFVSGAPLPPAPSQAPPS